MKPSLLGRKRPIVASGDVYQRLYLARMLRAPPATVKQATSPARPLEGSGTIEKELVPTPPPAPGAPLPNGVRIAPPPVGVEGTGRERTDTPAGLPLGFTTDTGAPLAVTCKTTDSFGREYRIRESSAVVVVPVALTGKLADPGVVVISVDIPLEAAFLTLPVSGVVRENVEDDPPPDMNGR